MRATIRQRTRIYLGCEGESEQSYGKRLNQIADEAGLNLHLDCDILQPGGGDPLMLVQLSISRIIERTQKRGSFAHRALILDKDKLSLNPAWTAQINALRTKHRLQVIWQDTCHEAFLLRHLADQANKRPQTTELALHSLKRIWPDYRKAMPAAELAARIDRAAVLRAAEVEVDFQEFLQLIGLIRRP
jgi:hypothetical protein